MISLVPYPVSVRESRGSFAIQSKTIQVGDCGDAKESLAIRHKIKSLGFAPVNKASLPPLTAVIGQPMVEECLPPDKEEGYALHCDARGLVIRGADRDGLFLGLTTLEQLLNGGKTVPHVKIEDYPAFRFRMHHDDISRKQVSTVKDFKRIIRLLSYYKVKYYTPYMEDMLYLPSFPDIGEGRGRLMPNEVKALLAEAERYNVIVFPTYSLIGHQENLLQHPNYRKYAREVFQEPSAYDVSKPSLRPYLRKVIKDVCSAFPTSPFFHACFDEVIGLTEKELLGHANWCATEVAKYGKEMLMWVDMFKNHYGLKKIHKLASNVIPVEWEYGDPGKMEKAYTDAKLTPLGLASYCCHSQFLPDFTSGKANLDAWAGVMRRWGGEGYGSSIWGDNGYENARDLCWNLYAYNAESSWTGQPGRKDFESRFQHTFYGRFLPELQKIIEKIAPQRRLSSHFCWQLFRYKLPALIRMVNQDPALAAKAQADRKDLQWALQAVARCRRLALREAAHLDHFTVALRRDLNVLDRVLLAERIRRGWSGTALRQALEKALSDLAEVKKLYTAVWLRHNKRPNIEVSLAVFDQVSRSLQDFQKSPPAPGRQFCCLNLEEAGKLCDPKVGGVPLGLAKINGIPYRFADDSWTHVSLDPKKPIVLSCDPARVKDIHLIYGGQAIPAQADEHKPLVEVRLLRNGRTVYQEKLLTVQHICDWWAPHGEHMWAGGGLKHTDPARVEYAVDAGTFFGVLHLHGFKPKGVEADALSLQLLPRGKANMALLAATLELDKPI